MVDFRSSVVNGKLTNICKLDLTTLNPNLNLNSRNVGDHSTKPMKNL